MASIGNAIFLITACATITNWTTTFPTYDHPHKYRIAAWATDLDGQQDTSKAQVQRICVRDPGDLSPCV